MTAGAEGATDIRRSLDEVLGRIAKAARRAGRDPSGVTLIGVTKTVPVERVRAAVEAGLIHLGENRVQEAEAKIARIPSGAAGPFWHLVGHLQSNKAGKAAGLFGCIHSLDGAELAARLDRLAGARSSPLDVLVQVDLGHEPAKHGVDAGLLHEMIERVAGLEHLRLRGLMTLPPLFDDPGKARPFFTELRRLRDALAARGRALEDLSMGMTNDFEVAVEEGATMVRVGRALFGDRPEGG